MTQFSNLHFPSLEHPGAYREPATTIVDLLYTPVNLPTLFPIKHDGPGLPVLVDLNWHGQTLTSENGGIVPSRSACSTFNDDREVIL